MDKDEHELNIQEAEEEHARDLELQHKDEDRHLTRIEDEIEKHLAIAIDVHKSMSFLVEYMKQSKKLNKSQHTAIMQFTNTAIKKEQSI